MLHMTMNLMSYDSLITLFLFLKKIVKILFTGEYLVMNFIKMENTYLL